MPCWIATVWWNAAVASVVVLKELRYLWDSGPMSFGALTTRASFCWTERFGRPFSGQPLGGLNETNVAAICDHSAFSESIGLIAAT
jgi:hypothetical protein